MRLDFVIHILIVIIFNLLISFVNNPIMSLPTFIGGNHADIKWDKLVSSNFIIFYQKEAFNEAQYALSHLERHLAALKDDIGITIDQKIQVVLFAKEGVSGFADPVTDTIQIRTAGKCKKDLFIHELTHHIMYKHFDQVLGVIQRLFHLIPLPAWFLEGLAEYESNSHGPFRKEQFLNSMYLNDTYPSYARLHNILQSASWGPSGYIVGGELIKLILKKMKKIPLKLLKLHSIFKDNTLGYRYLWAFDATLKELINMDGEQLYKEWIKKHKDISFKKFKDKDRILDHSTAIPFSGYTIPSSFQPLDSLGNYVYLDMSNDRGYYHLKFIKTLNKKFNIYDNIYLPFKVSPPRFSINHERNKIAFIETEYDLYGSPYSTIWELDLKDKSFTKIYTATQKISQAFYANKNFVLLIRETSKEIMALLYPKLSTDSNPDSAQSKESKIEILKEIKTPLNIEIQDVSKYYGSIVYTIEDDKYNKVLYLYQQGKHKKINKILSNYYPSSVRFIDDENLIGLCYPAKISNIFTYNIFNKRFHIHTDYADSISNLYYDKHHHLVFFNYFKHPYWYLRMIDFKHDRSRHVPLKQLLAGKKSKSPFYTMPITKRGAKLLNNQFSFQNDMHKEHIWGEFKHLFTVPFMGNDERGMTIGGFSVPIIDSLETHLVQASATYGLYSERPSYFLSYTNKQFQPTIQIMGGDDAFYNGRINSKISYLQKRFGQISISMYFNPIKASVSFSKELASFNRLLGPEEVTTGYRSLNMLGLSYQNTALFGAYGISFNYSVTDTLKKSVFEYMRFWEQAWVNMDMPWDYHLLRFSFEHALTTGDHTLNAPEIYTTFKGLRNTNEKGLNNLVFPLDTPYTVNAIVSQQGDQKIVAKIAYDCPLIDDLDKLVSIFYLHQINTTNFLYYGQAWKTGEFDLNNFNLIYGLALSLSIKNKGVSFAPSLGFTVDLIESKPAIYASFSYTPLL